MNIANATVLTVEDDPIVRADLRLVLEEAGFDVCADARDGAEAVELARLHTPDLILLDLGLPGIDGVEATRQILNERDVPIVALTGRSEALASEALDAGAITCVRKPFAARQLVETLTETLNAHTDLAAREGSRATIAEIVGSLGYPATWADELEERAYRSGHVWRRAG